MYKGLKVAVVVPAHNEENHIADVVHSMPELVDAVYVVNDASKDDTEARARAVTDPRLVVHSLPQNGGVGAAIMAGHDLAFASGADVSVVMAGDGQMDPDYLPQLLDPIAAGRVQFTKANRFFERGSFTGMPWLRIVGNVGLSFLTKAASGYWNLFDPQNGYTAIHRDAAARVPWKDLAPRYDFENDLLINLNILRVPAQDVPIPAIYRDEVSGLKPGRDGLRIARRLFRGFWERIWWKYVVQSFSAVALLLFAGMALTAFGLLMGAFVLAYTIGPRTASAGTVLMSVAPLLSGIHMLLFAMLIDIQESSPPAR